MKGIQINKRSKYIESNIRQSQSLHCRLKKTNIKDRSKRCIKNIEKKKIEFIVQNKITFEQLNNKLYRQLQMYLINEGLLSDQKIQKILKNIVGFQSIDGDINFDYRFSLKKGILQKTKFFYPFIYKNTNCSLIKYKIYNCLAIGGFSKVYLARSYENGQFYAIKFIKKMKNQNFIENEIQSIKNEYNISKQLDHPFLVKLIHAFQIQHFYCMVFQYCPGGQLFYLLKKVRMMSQEIARFYFLQILYAIQYMHSKSIIYRDLKPQNILVDADGNCKIVDFGLSKKINNRCKTFSYCGSAEYMAPQMIMRTGHSFGIDYYSLGALLYELVTGLPPYYTKNHDELQQSIIRKQISFPVHVELSNEIKDLLEKLLKKDEKYRLGSYVGIKQILFHPWIGKINSGAILSKQIRSPYPPNLQQYNFDLTQLGNDQQQFTTLVHEDLQDDENMRQYYRQFYKNPILQEYINNIGRLIRDKQNIQQSKMQMVSKIKKSSSRQKLREGIKIKNILQRIQLRNNSKQKQFRSSDITQDKIERQGSKLYPYLRQQLLNDRYKQGNLLKNKINMIDKLDKYRKLKRIKIQKNKIE